MRAFKAELLAELKPRSSELAVAAVAGDAARVRRRPRPHARAPRARRAARGLLPAAQASFRTGSPTSSTTRMLAIWFMDDGYTRIRAGAAAARRDRDERLL